MKLRSLTAVSSLAGVRVLVRIDWNVPLQGALEPEASLKIERSLETIHWLQKKQAIVILLTHLGRPEGRDPYFSTEQLVPLLKKTYHLDIAFHAESVGRVKERKLLLQALTEVAPGSVHLLENVRFEAGEEKNTVTLAKAYASLGEIFVNDAFASCHRSHVSVVGIASQLPAYAGFSLQEEVQALTRLIQKPTRPAIAFVGGAKLSTKIPVLQELLAQYDQVFLGGAMATTIRAAQGMDVGASLVEKTTFPLAKRLGTAEHLQLPIDILVTKRLAKNMHTRVATFETITPGEIMVDVGPKTCKLWGEAIRNAQTILWNGPVGIIEYSASGAGSRFLARAISLRAKGKVFGVAGGGDTIPLLVQTKTAAWFDHVSTGGGAMLEFVSCKGMLPGLKSLFL